MVDQVKGLSALKDTEANTKELGHGRHNSYLARFATGHEPIAHGPYRGVPSQSTDGGQVKPGPNSTGANPGESARACFARLSGLWVQPAEGHPTLGTQTLTDRWQLAQDQDRCAMAYARNRGEQLNLLVHLTIVFDKGIHGPLDPFGLLFQLFECALQAAKDCTWSPRGPASSLKAITRGLALLFQPSQMPAQCSELLLVLIWRVRRPWANALAHSGQQSCIYSICLRPVDQHSAIGRGAGRVDQRVIDASPDHSVNQVLVIGAGRLNHQVHAPKCRAHRLKPLQRLGDARRCIGKACDLPSLRLTHLQSVAGNVHAYIGHKTHGPLIWMDASSRKPLRCNLVYTGLMSQDAVRTQQRRRGWTYLPHGLRGPG